MNKNIKTLITTIIFMTIPSCSMYRGIGNLTPCLPKEDDEKQKIENYIAKPDGTFYKELTHQRNIFKDPDYFSLKFSLEF